LMKALGGSMALRRRGTIVNISSDAAVNAYSGWGAYSASKAALDQLGRVLGAELGEQGVRGLRVDPGRMGTALHRAAPPGTDPATLAAPDAVARRILALIEQSAVPTGSRVEIAHWREAS